MLVPISKIYVKLPETIPKENLKLIIRMYGYTSSRL